MSNKWMIKVYRLTGKIGDKVCVIDNGGPFTLKGDVGIIAGYAKDGFSGKRLYIVKFPKLIKFPSVEDVYQRLHPYQLKIIG